MALELLIWPTREQLEIDTLRWVNGAAQAGALVGEESQAVRDYISRLIERYPTLPVSPSIPSSSYVRDYRSDTPFEVHAPGFAYALVDVAWSAPAEVFDALRVAHRGLDLTVFSNQFDVVAWPGDDRDDPWDALADAAAGMMDEISRDIHVWEERLGLDGEGDNSSTET